MMVIGVVVNALDPKHAFAYITAVSTVGIIVIWATILLCQMAFRRKVARGELPASDYRAPGAPVTTWLALAFLALVFVLLFIRRGRTCRPRRRRRVVRVRRDRISDVDALRPRPCLLYTSDAADE